MSTRPANVRRRGEQGSALLIVFVFAAVIAIMLYRELPVAAFEARRQKEELLVDRGNEYVRAVQLFYRRNRGAFPPTIEALENTNNVRFLRERYKDPFTGEDNWRLLHAGPGGVLLDSKVNSPQQLPGMPATGQPAGGQLGSPMGSSQSAFGKSSGSGFGQSSGGFGSTSTFGSNSSDDSGAVTVPDLPPPRPPAVQANGNGNAKPSETDINSQLAALAAGDAGLTSNGATGPMKMSTAVTAAQGNPSGNDNVMQMMSPLLNSPTAAPNPQGTAATVGAPMGGRMGQIAGGAGIAGVASKAKGNSIKLVHDQDDYSKWEFYYDPTQDTSLRPALPGGTAPNGTGQVQTGTTVNQQQQQSVFGSSPTTIGATGTNQPATPQPGAPASPNTGQAAPTPPPPDASIQPQ